MIQIIKPGKLPVKHPKIFTGECSNCGCYFSASERELEFKRAEPTVICPTEGCNRYVTVKEYILRGS